MLLPFGILSSTCPFLRFAGHQPWAKPAASPCPYQCHLTVMNCYAWKHAPHHCNKHQVFSREWQGKSSQICTRLTILIFWRIWCAKLDLARSSESPNGSTVICKLKMWPNMLWSCDLKLWVRNPVPFKRSELQELQLLCFGKLVSSNQKPKVFRFSGL